MKENHGLQLRSKSHNDHSVCPLPADPGFRNLSEGKVTENMSLHTSFYTMGVEGSDGVESFPEVGDFFFSVAIEIVNVALAETLRESWCLASPGLLL